MNRRCFVLGGLLGGVSLTLPKIFELNRLSNVNRGRTIVYGASQSGTLKLAAALKGEYLGNSNASYLGNYFNIFGSLFKSDIESTAIPCVKKQSFPGCYKTNFRLERNRIVEFKDFVKEPFSERKELLRREELLRKSNESHLIVVSSWVDAHDDVGVCDRLLNNPKNNIYVVVPSNIEKLLLRQALADVTDIWSRPVGLPKLDPEGLTAPSSIVFEDVKLELLAFKRRLSIPHAKYVFSSQLEDKRDILQVIGKNGSGSWNDKENFEPEFRKKLRDYFTNRKEILTMVSKLERVIA